MKQQNEPEVAELVEPLELAPWETPVLVKVDVSSGTLNSSGLGSDGSAQFS